MKTMIIYLLIFTIFLWSTTYLLVNRYVKAIPVIIYNPASIVEVEIEAHSGWVLLSDAEADIKRIAGNKGVEVTGRSFDELFIEICTCAASDDPPGSITVDKITEIKITAPVGGYAELKSEIGSLKSKIASLELKAVEKDCREGVSKVRLALQDVNTFFSLSDYFERMGNSNAVQKLNALRKQRVSESHFALVAPYSKCKGSLVEYTENDPNFDSQPELCYKFFLLRELLSAPDFPEEVKQKLGSDLIKTVTTFMDTNVTYGMIQRNLSAHERDLIIEAFNEFFGIIPESLRSHAIAQVSKHLPVEDNNPPNPLHLKPTSPKHPQGPQTRAEP
jgi:hypothetical protein